MIFRPFTGDITKPVEEPEDYGYKFKISSGIKIIIATLRDNGFNQTGSNKDWIINWGFARSKKSSAYSHLQPWQKVNSFPKTSEITRKDKINRNISQMVIKHGKAFDFVPKTYILPQELALLMRDGEKKKYQKKYYICKPSAASQGKGIFVTNDIEDVRFPILILLRF